MTVLVAIHNASTLLFGVFISSAFLGIIMNRKNILTLLAFSSGSGLMYALSFLLFQADFTARIYPLIVHLPLILFLAFYYRYKILCCTLSVSVAYMCCQISKWVGLAAEEITHLHAVYYTVRIITTLVVFVLLIRFVSTAAAELVQKPSKDLLIFSLLPFTYYIFDYATGVYTALLYSGKAVVTEFLGFALCIAYLLFLLIYFRQYEEKRKAEQKNRLAEMQQAQSRKEIEAIKRSEYAVSLLRHDMRHFLANISSLLENKEYDKACTYISEVVSYTDRTAIRKYSKNETVNMILSSYGTKIEENRIDFRCFVEVPCQLTVSDVDLTSILSNALENALHAVLPLEEEKRHIVFDMRMNDGKLLISCKNTFAEKPQMSGGIPLTSRKEHGFGTQSIRYVTEKLGGNCQFSLKDDWFVLRIIL